MEVKLQELISQIKKDGVEAAEAEAEAILNAAKAEAEKIVKEAKAEAEKILKNSKAENERMVKSSEDAIRQAGRNLLISFRESVAKELKKIIGENVAAVYASNDLSALIVKVVENWAQNTEAEALTVILNSEDLKKLEETLLCAFNEKALKGVTLKANDSFDGGFRIGIENGTAYYDFSADAVVDMVSNYLSPKVIELLKEA